MNGHSQWPMLWPMATATGHCSGQWPQPLAAALANGHSHWPLHCPLPKAVATSLANTIFLRPAAGCDPRALRSPRAVFKHEANGCVRNAEEVRALIVLYLMESRSSNHRGKHVSLRWGLP